MSKLFGTSGARGVTNKDITPELALRIAYEWGKYLTERSRKGPPHLTIAHDNRHGASMLAYAAIAGAQAAGAQVHFIGCASTGIMCAYMKDQNHDGGILITGSHMPPERIGIIPLLGDGRYAPVSMTDELAVRIEAAELCGNGVEWSDILSVEHPPRAGAAYISMVTRSLDVSSIYPARFKVLLDTGNGTACLVAKQLFEGLGCEVVMLYDTMKPMPQRKAEVRASTCTKAIEMVRTHDCDAGFCFDGDADRVLVITKEGNPLSEDLVGALFARHILKAGDTCVTAVNASGIIEWTCRDIGARVHYCAVGQPAMGEALAETHAPFAYEESGKYFFAQQQLWSDGLLTAVKILELMATRTPSKSLGGLVSDFPVFHQVKRSLDVPSDKKDIVFSHVLDLLKTGMREEGDTDFTLDGFRRSFPDTSWVLVRVSGTEPIIRVMSDSRSLSRADALADQATDLLQQALAEASK